MVINILYLFIVVIGISYGIMIFIKTRHKMIPFGLAILVFSLVLEIQWLNAGDYITYTSDFFRTLRDIARTILTVLGFKIAYRLKGEKNPIEYSKKIKKSKQTKTKIATKQTSKRQ